MKVIIKNNIYKEITKCNLTLNFVMVLDSGVCSVAPTRKGNLFREQMEYKSSLVSLLPKYLLELLSHI